MVKLNINHKEYDVPLKGHETLLEVLRDQLGLTGTKTACQDAECCACTVIVNRKAVLSCITLACDVEGDEIITIEGLAEGDTLHPIQEAFLEKGAVQCGFCTPGMVLASKALLDENPQPSEDQIKDALDGNLCRCAGYSKIFEAVSYAAELLKQKEQESN